MKYKKQLKKGKKKSLFHIRTTNILVQKIDENKTRISFIMVFE